MQFSESNALVASAILPDGKASQSALWAKATKTGTFYQQHLWLPLTAFAALSVLLMGLGADQWLADRIYVAGGNAWVLQSNPLVEGIIHEGGRQASKWAWIAVAVCLLLALARRTFASWRMPLTTLHALLLGLVISRWNAKPVLTVLLLVTALASHYMNAYRTLLNILFGDEASCGAEYVAT